MSLLLTGRIVLEAAILTSVVVVGLTLYTFWAAKRGQDFSFLGPFLFSAVLVLIVFGLIQVCIQGFWIYNLHLLCLFCFSLLFAFKRIHCNAVPFPSWKVVTDDIWLLGSDRILWFHRLWHWQLDQAFQLWRVHLSSNQPLSGYYQSIPRSPQHLQCSWQLDSSYTFYW